jgi:hypothetical protein
MEEIIINESHHEKTLNAKVGDEIEIRLKHNPAVNGYWVPGENWDTDKNGNIVRVTTSKGPGAVVMHDVCVIDVNKDRTLKLDGATTHKFKVTSPGRAEIELWLKPMNAPLGDKSAVRDRFHVTILVD